MATRFCAHVINNVTICLWSKGAVTVTCYGEFDDAEFMISMSKTVIGLQFG